MRNSMLTDLKNLIWAGEIVLCVAAVFIGLIICAVTKYNPVTEVDVDTHAGTQQAVEGIVMNDNYEVGVYVSDTNTYNAG